MSRLSESIRGLRALLLLLLCCAVPTVLAQSVDPLPFKDRAEEERFQKLAHELRCVQCQNNSLADSDGMIARDVRHEVHRLMQQGRTDAEIKQHLVERYGEFVLFKPPVVGETLALWYGPALALVAALIWLGWMLRRRAASAAGKIDPVEES